MDGSDLPLPSDADIEAAAKLATHPRYLALVRELNGLAPADRNRMVHELASPEALAARGIDLPPHTPVTTRTFTPIHEEMQVPPRPDPNEMGPGAVPGGIPGLGGILKHIHLCTPTWVSIGT
jgi:hypothetical protein